MLFRILSFRDTPLRFQTGVTYHMCLMMIMMIIMMIMMVVIILSLYIEAVITLLLLTIG